MEAARSSAARIIISVKISFQRILDLEFEAGRSVSPLKFAPCSRLERMVDVSDGRTRESISCNL